MNATSRNEISALLIDRVLERLGLTQRLQPDYAGLCLLYEAWCRSAPFDNIRKLIHIGRGETAPFPGDSPADFLEAWLKYGNGGTCWAGNGALATLLENLGFNATRGVGTMMVAPDLPPNHGTVVVRMNGANYLTDASMLHMKPLLLDERAETEITHPAWAVRCSMRDGKFHINWKPMHQTGTMDCRIEKLESDAGEFSDYHERTRPWSPFNYSLYARKVRGNEMIGAAYGKRVTITAMGEMIEDVLPAEDRLPFLIGEMGIAEELAVQIPEDKPLPPPPKR